MALVARFTMFLLFFISACLAAETPKTFGHLGEKYGPTSRLDSVESPYRKKVCELVESWPKEVPFTRTSAATAGQPTLDSECYTTPGNPTYVGVGQRMVIAAPFERVSAAVDDYSGYVGIFEGLVSVHSLSTDENHAYTEWEESIPFPFVSNVHNQMIHLINQPRPGFRIYRYGLKKASDLIKDDGVIVLEQKSPTETVYTEYDFFDANWGIVKSFGIDRLWKESVEGVYQSDLALKLRVENPDWSADRVLKESRQAAKALIDRKDYCPKRILAPSVNPERSKCL